VRYRLSPAQLRIVFYVIDHQARIMQHLNDILYDFELFARDRKPEIESLDEQGADFFASVGGNISKGFQNERLVGLRPF
jgi:hypothetical protein